MPRPCHYRKDSSSARVDIQNDKERAEVYKLLQNYVEDDDNMFRFDYSEKFLLWGIDTTGISQGLACRCASGQQQAIERIHHGNSS